MAIPHFRAQIIGRTGTRGVVASAAYRHRAKMLDESVGSHFSYKHGVGPKELVHAELAIPDQTPQWFRDMIDGRTPAKASEALWNKVEAEETHSLGQLAREIVIALPIELSREQNIALMREFIAENLTARGMVADWVYHDKKGNPHVHVMHTLRPLAEKGFGPKKVARLDDAGNVVRDGKRIVYDNWAGYKGELIEWRLAWGQAANRHLALAGHDARIDMRSFADQGLDITPTVHMGPTGSGLERRSPGASYRAEMNSEAKAVNAALLESDPAQLFKLITQEKSVFDERDIARSLHRYIDDPAQFQNALAAVMTAPDLVVLRPRVTDYLHGLPSPRQVFTTKDMIRVETGMLDAAASLSGQRGYGVSQKAVDAAFASRTYLAPEQREAVRHVTGDNRLAAVVGLAGAGKTTLLSAANEVWTASGYRVFGAALAGKAAEGLQQEAGIPSRTLASWERSWSFGRDQLAKGDILVVDEAGMVSSRQLARIVKTVDDAGAKLILVGDSYQLQPIEAGAAFRGIAERAGYIELQGIRRQHDEWARAATVDFARGETGQALKAYEDRGFVSFVPHRGDARTRIVAMWMEGEAAGKSQAILAHSNDEVQKFNQVVRGLLRADGKLGPDQAFATSLGERSFAVADRVLFRENNRDIGVMNGMFGRVAEAGPGHLSIDLDNGRRVEITPDTYAAVDHGYASTVHKAQGVTVDRAYVLATKGMDQHLAYVAMSRHRESAHLFAATADFADAEAFTKSLSRYGGKELTTDYLPETTARRNARDFAERRGIDTLRSFGPALRAAIVERQKWVREQRDRLRAAWGRLQNAFARQHGRLPAQAVSMTATTPAARSASDEAPAMLPAVTRYGLSIEDHGKAAAFLDKAVIKYTAYLEEAAAAVYRDPQRAVARIQDAIAGSTQNYGYVNEEVRQKPETFGALKGSASILDGFTARKEHRAALDAVSWLSSSTAQVQSTYQSVKSVEMEQERARRIGMKVEIPALSKEAFSTLQALDTLRQKNPERYAASVARLPTADLKVLAEIERFSAALTKRFGEGTLIQNGKRPEDRVPAEDKERFQKLRKIMEAAQHVAAKVIDNKVVRTVAVDREQGITR